MIPLAGAVALLLVSGLAAAPGAAAGEPPGDDASIRMTVVNWGQEVDLAGPDPAYAVAGADAPTTHVRVDITPPSSGLHGYYGRLTAPDAAGGEVKLYCGIEYMRVDSVQRCAFDVPMSAGPNRLIFDLQSASFDGIVSQEGTVIGGRVGQVAVLEAALPYRNWALVPPRDDLTIRGENTTALRYRIMNTGDLPFRAPDSCQPGGTVWPYQQLLCPLRTAGPVYALAGDYAVPVSLEDPSGAVTVLSIEGHLRADGVTSVVPARDRPLRAVGVGS
ncbi:MAG: hypothetical protein ACTHKX_11755 [Pseudolysinimonas sp.]